MSEYLKSRVDDLLDQVLTAQDRMIRREIDASCCRTRWDWDKLHEAQDAYHEAREKAIADILALIKGVR